MFFIHGNINDAAASTVPWLACAIEHVDDNVIQRPILVTINLTILRYQYADAAFLADLRATILH